jgi:hypothetical protein
MIMFQIPIELKIALGGVLTMLITAGLKSFAKLLGKDFSGGWSALVAVIVASILFSVDALVALTPVEYQEVVAGIFGLIITVLSAFGLHYTRKNP